MYLVVEEGGDMGKHLEAEVHGNVLSPVPGGHTLGCVGAHLTCLAP